MARESELIHPTAIIEENCSIGKNTMIAAYAVIRPSTWIGDDCKIGIHTVLDGDVFVGNRVTIHTHCYIPLGAHIEDDVFIGPGFAAANTRRIKHGRDYPLVIHPCRIRRAARIGLGVVTLPGIEIGENALIGAGSVVTKNVPAKEIWIGTPAKLVGVVPDDELL